MVQDLGLTHRDRLHYETALTKSGEQWWEAELLHRDRSHAATLVLEQDGQINLDATGAITNSPETGSMWAATLTLPDPEDRLGLDTDALFLDRRLKLTRATWVDVLGKTVRCDAFSGPITKCDHAGDSVLAIEAMSPEIWARGTVQSIHKYPKGALVTNVIYDLWHNVIGEPAEWLEVPQMKHRLPGPYQVGPLTVDGAWGAIQYLAGTIDCDAFYDGASMGILRQSNTGVVFEWDSDLNIIYPAPQDSTLLGGIGGSANDPTQIVNDYVVLGQGKPPKGGGKPPLVRGEAVAPVGSRFYPQSLGNPGMEGGLYLTERATLDHVRLDSTATSIAKTRLRRRLQVAYQAAFNSVVIPHLQPFDKVRVKTSGMSKEYEYLQTSIPLIFDPNNQPQTVGFNKRVSLPPQRNRR